MHGERLPLDELCGGRPDLAGPLRALVERYLSITTTLDGDAITSAVLSPGGTLPHFDGFQTIERIGAGGMGEVFKLKDLRLERVVAAKVVRGDRSPRWTSGMEGFLPRRARWRCFPIAGSSRSSTSGRTRPRRSSSWSSWMASSSGASDRRSRSPSGPGS